jgi:hypothetical protein
MKKNGLVRLYLLFARDTGHPERLTISGRIGINRKGWKVYQTSPEDLIISSSGK